MILLSMSWSGYYEYNTALESARTEVRAYHSSITSIRLWVAGHGGVYVPITATTPPNPFLADIPERDVETTSGMQLTLVNPAYMTHQLQTIMQELHTITGKITSLNPINPINLPDDWERTALEGFQRGELERTEVNYIDGTPFMRLIRPLKVQAPCLQCHAHQGYKLGDIRGGLSTSVSMESHKANMFNQIKMLALAHFGLWIIVLIGIWLAWVRLNNSRQQLNNSYKLLKYSESRLSEAQQIAHLGHWDWVIDTGELTWSDEVFRIFDVNPDEFKPNLKSFMSKIHRDDQQKLIEHIEMALNNPKCHYAVEHRIILPDGTVKKTAEWGKVHTDEAGVPVRMIGSIQDITPSWIAQQRIQQSSDNEKLLSQLLRISLLPLGIESFLSQSLQELSDSGQIFPSSPKCWLYLFENDNTNRVLKLKAQVGLEDIEKATRQFLNPEVQFWDALLSDTKPVFISQIQPELLGIEEIEGISLIAIPLQAKHESLGLLAFELPEGDSPSETDTIMIQRIAEVISLGISRRYAEEESEYRAYYDLLTGLPNRRMLHERLTHEVGLAHRKECSGALLCVDLDHFKNINDALGHKIGDQLLREVANRIKSCLREGDLVARVGGDEFFILLTNLSGTEIQVVGTAQGVTQDFRKELERAFIINGRSMHATCSIGITIFSEHECQPDGLIRQADTALYRAKMAGRNCIRFYDQTMQQEASYRLELETGMREALINEQFSLAYQPQINHLGELVGTEALLRWQSNTHGFISPADFIPIAEDCGIIIPIGDWVMREAMSKAKECVGNGASGFRMAINISQLQFKQFNFVDQVKLALEDINIDPRLIELELTESMLVDEVENAIEKMNQLRELGIRISIDDFGTGFSSLSYLKKLPIDKLKIDQSFVRDVDKNQQDAAIIESIISLGHNLGLDLVAEGVETDAEKEFLEAKGCTTFQGYLFYRPMSWINFQETFCKKPH